MTSGVLWSGAFVAWIRYLTRWRLDPRQWTQCKLNYFLFYLGRHYSSALLVIMCAEKCFALYVPSKAKSICTVKTAKWTTTFVGIVLVFYNLLYLVFYEWNGEKGSCNVAHKEILDRVDSVLYSFGPFVIMLVANTAIIYKFMRVKCQSTPKNTSESTNKALYKSATRGTAMVITVSMMFIILTSPVALDNATGSRLASNPLYYAFMIIMQYVNHSINGVLYCVVGSKFRTELIKILRKRKRPETISGGNTRNDTDTGYVPETRY